MVPADNNERIPVPLFDILCELPDCIHMHRVSCESDYVGLEFPKHGIKGFLESQIQNPDVMFRQDACSDILQGERFEEKYILSSDGVRRFRRFDQQYFHLALSLNLP